MDFRRLIVVIVVLCFTLVACVSNKIQLVNEQLYFKKYALSTCLRQSFDCSPLKDDAFVAVDAYLQKGNMPLEAYDELEILVDLWRNKDYSTKEGGQVQIPKCLDLYESQDLADLYQKYTPCKGLDSWLNKESYIKSCK